MDWIDIKNDKTRPDNDTWVLVKTSLKWAPKYEVCHFKGNEWYLPANDDSCEEEDVVKWAYIQEN